jgi:hypothetical protein
MEDFVVCHHTKNGLYFVRPAYHAEEKTKTNEKKNVSPFIMVLPNDHGERDHQDLGALCESNYSCI